METDADIRVSIPRSTTPRRSPQLHRASHSCSDWDLRLRSEYETLRLRVLHHEWIDPLKYRDAVVALGDALADYGHPVLVARHLRHVTLTLESDSCLGRRV